MTKKKTITKAVIYGSNFLLSRFGGNGLGAIVFSALDIASAFSSKVRNSKYSRLAKTGGAIIYGVSCANNLCSAVENPIFILPAIFDASMTYQLGTDAYKEYRERNSVSKDIGEVVNNFKKL